jgi:hypothetical protein
VKKEIPFQDHSSSRRSPFLPTFLATRRRHYWQSSSFSILGFEFFFTAKTIPTFSLSAFLQFPAQISLHCGKKKKNIPTFFLSELSSNFK